MKKVEVVKELVKLARILYSQKPEMMKSAIEFLTKNPKPADSATHKWAEKNGFEVDEFEATIYEIAGNYVNSFLNQGRSNDKKIGPKDVDAKELAIGMKIEMEHTNDKKMAERISLDHLTEMPDYYTRLKKMESEAEKK